MLKAPIAGFLTIIKAVGYNVGNLNETGGQEVFWL
jgi:hypothetical protein